MSDYSFFIQCLEQRLFMEGPSMSNHAPVDFICVETLITYNPGLNSHIGNKFHG